MLPYFELPALHLPLGQKVDIFGVLSAIGVGVGALLAARAARRYAPGDDRPLRNVVTWAVVFGLYGGHFMHLFAYHPEELAGPAQQAAMASALQWLFGLERGAAIPQLALVTGIASMLKFWEGLSSMGGVLGSLLGIFVYFHRSKTPLLPWLDALALGTAPGWTVARIGCFLVHDHPGVRTGSFLAVAFPAAGYGGPRFDLGLFDACVLAALTLGLYRLARTRPKQGRLMGVLALGYSTCRFFLDFLRATDLSYVDKRYLGLTPAQYVVAVLALVGLWLLVREAPETAPLALAPSGAEGARVGTGAHGR